MDNAKNEYEHPKSNKNGKFTKRAAKNIGYLERKHVIAGLKHWKRCIHDFIKLYHGGSLV